MRFWIGLSLTFILGFQTSVLGIHQAIHKSIVGQEASGVTTPDEPCDLCLVCNATYFSDFSTPDLRIEISATIMFSTLIEAVIYVEFQDHVWARGPPAILG